MDRLVSRQQAKQSTSPVSQISQQIVPLQICLLLYKSQWGLHCHAVPEQHTVCAGLGILQQPNSHSVPIQSPLNTHPARFSLQSHYSYSLIPDPPMLLQGDSSINSAKSDSSINSAKESYAFGRRACSDVCCSAIVLYGIFWQHTTSMCMKTKRWGQMIESCVGNFSRFQAPHLACTKKIQLMTRVLPELQNFQHSWVALLHNRDSIFVVCSITFLERQFEHKLSAPYEIWICPPLDFANC